MKYCMLYDRNSQCMFDVDELKIYYHLGKSHLSLISFLQAKPDQKIVLYTKTDDQEIQDVLTQCTEYNNLILCLEDDGLDLVPLLKELNIPFFFAKPAQTIGDIYAQSKYGVSEVIIGCDLGFQLDKVKAIAALLNVKIRARYYTIDILDENRPYLDFLIRPEDVQLYEQYIDTIELPSIEPWSYVDGIFKAYKQHAWNGTLQEFFPLSTIKINNKYLAPYWGSKRVSCGRKCLYSDKCSICETLTQLENTLKNADIPLPADVRGAKAEE